MTFTTIPGTNDCIIQQDYERDRHRNVLGGVSRVLTKVTEADPLVYPVRYEWIDTVPIKKRGEFLSTGAPRCDVLEGVSQ